MIEHKLIKCAILSREAFSIIVDIIQDRELSPYAKTIMNTIETYYDNDLQAECIDHELLQEIIQRKYPEKKEEFIAFFANLPVEISVANILKYVVEQKKEVLGNKLASMLIDDVSDGNIAEIMNEFLLLGEELVEEKQIYSMDDIDSLVEQAVQEELIPLYPSIISDKLNGGIPRQGQVLIYARPDVGKTTIAMNIAGGAVMDGYRVLYCGNEDPAERMILRFLTRITGKTIDEIKAAPVEAINIAKETAKGKYQFIDMHPGTIAQIRGHIKRFSPDIVIVDQIRLVKMVKDNPTRNLEEACIAMRTLAKEFGFVSIPVTQAGESAANKQFLKMEDVEWSNTGVQGQMDLMIGAGQTVEMKQMNTIMLNLTKNKLSAPINPFVCKINYPLNTIKGPRQ